MRILSWGCRIIHQSNSPKHVLPTMQSDDVRQENMATIILLVNASKESNLSTQELQNSRFLWQFISCKETRLMTTCDRSQCPDFISTYDFNSQCPQVKFIYHVNKYLLVPSFKLETAEIIRNSVTKMRSSMFRFTRFSTSTSA